MPVKRHDWVWLTSQWAGDAPPDVIAHHQAGLPFVVARQAPQDDKQKCNLGLTTIPKVRTGFSVVKTDIHRIASPPLLETALSVAPDPWRPGLVALNQALPGLQVFGSLAWQYVTGQSHMTEQSDVDILFTPTTRAAIEPGLRILAESDLRLDGEMVFPDGCAVSWKEWVLGKNPVLIKCMQSVGLWDRAVMLKAFST